MELLKMRRFLVLLLLLMLCISPSLASENYTAVLESLDNATVAVAVPENVTPEAYRTIASGDIMVQCADPVILSVEEKPDGIHVEDTGSNDTVRDFRISYADIAEYVKNDTITVKHIGDAGFDASWIQNVRNQGGYAYFEDVPFSEIILGGFSGIYQKTSTVTLISPSQSLSSLNASGISYISASVTPTYTETSPYAIPTDGLVAWYRMDDGTGLTLTDSSGNGKHGSYISGNMNWTQNGKYNGAGRFDGSDYATTPSLLLGAPAATVIVWVNKTGYKQYGSFVSDWSTPLATSGWILGYENPEGTIRFYMSNGAVGTSIPNSNFSYGWHMVTGTFNSTTDRLGSWVDTHKASSTTGFNSVNPNSSGLASIGRHNTNYYCNAEIDQVIVYNRSLSDAEIIQIYYDGLQEMALRTNSNTSTSPTINGTDTVAIPYHENDSAITSIVASAPVSVVRDSITIRDYINTSSPFTLSTSVGYTENTTKIYESAGDGNYTLGITYIPSVNQTNGTLYYTSSDADLLNAEWIGDDIITSPASGIAYNTSNNTFVIPLGDVVAGTNYTYDVSLSWANTPQAYFSTSRVTGWSPCVVNFTDESTGHPTSWYWDFGDGNTSTEQSPSHTYYNGTYLATLVATTGAGNTSYGVQIIATPRHLEANDTVAIVAIQKDQLSAVEVHSSAITMIQTSEQAALYDAVGRVSSGTKDGYSLIMVAILVGGCVLLLKGMGLIDF
jgi:hypothetical protein